MEASLANCPAVMDKLCAPLNATLEILAKLLTLLLNAAKASRPATTLAAVSLSVIPEIIGFASALDPPVILATVAPLTVRLTPAANLLIAVASEVNCLKVIPTFVAPGVKPMLANLPKTARLCKESKVLAILLALSFTEIETTLGLATTEPALDASTLITL